MPAVRWLSVRQLRPDRGRRRAGVGLRPVRRQAGGDGRAAPASSTGCRPRRPTGRDVWVDYVADTGDGFDATFATACCLAGVPGLVVAAGARRSGDRRRSRAGPAQADLLVLGGDQVYPVASAPAYEERLNEVLRAAARTGRGPAQPAGGRAARQPRLVRRAGRVPAQLLRVLGAARARLRRRRPPRGSTDLPAPAGRDDVGGWGAFQSRSYFAVQLSPRWWLWGLDSQLDAPIDAEQLAYFHDARRLLGDADVILCTASPSWLEAAGERVYARAGGHPVLHAAVVRRPGARPGARPDPAGADRRPAPLRPLRAEPDPSRCPIPSRPAGRRPPGEQIPDQPHPAERHAVQPGAGDLRGRRRLPGLHPPPPGRPDPGLAALADRLRGDRALPAAHLLPQPGTVPER